MTSSNLHASVTLDDFNWTAMRSDDGWQREGVWRDDARIAAHAQATAAAAADQAAAPTIEFLLSSRVLLGNNQISAANHALTRIEPGLCIGAVSERTAARVLGSYFTPAVVADLLG